MDEVARPVPGDLCALPAREMASLVRDRLISPVELIGAHLERIAASDPAIRAFQVVRADKALAEAAALAERTDLADLPLAGVPVAVKDNVDVAGEPTRMGSAATSQAAAEADDELVSRLRAAGCVVIGKTQLPELAIWPFTEPAVAAATRNPWNRSRTPGGSTGGGAAAVAAGMAALALGSDGGGSIRIPAACCGLFGLKPSPGLVPLGRRRQRALARTDRVRPARQDGRRCRAHARRAGRHDPLPGSACAGAPAADRVLRPASPGRRQGQPRGQGRPRRSRRPAARRRP